jgi:glycosyltransferase involved in cell wall biosynthesis
MAPRPFLTVITRTMGARATLVDTLTSLAAQDDDDVEVRLIVNSGDDEVRQRVERTVASFDASFRDRVHVHTVAEAHRVRPLNVGLDSAAGRYVSVLDDDDIVFGGWVAQFRECAEHHDGMVLRCRAVDQFVDAFEADDGVHAVASSGFIASYKAGFDLAAHLVGGQSPQGSVAFPVDEVRRLGLRFDESMVVCEDLDFLLRCVAELGIADTGTFAMVYRRWTSTHSSMHSVDPEVWEASMQQIVERLDARPLVLPPGSASRLYQAGVQEIEVNKLSEGERGLLRRAEAAERRAASLAHQYAELERRYVELAEHLAASDAAQARPGFVRRLGRRRSS